MPPVPDPFAAVQAPRRTRLADTIADQVEQHVVAGALKAGDPLPSERELAQRLGVSRPSLREALLLLESRGLLRPRRSGGWDVADLTAPLVTDPLALLLARQPHATADVLEVRHALECLAAYHAAERATPEQAQHLVMLAKPSRRRTREPNPLADTERDAQFHLAIADASGNVALAHVMRGLFQVMRMQVLAARERLYEGNPAHLAALDAQHAALAQAIAAHDPEAARAAADSHLGFVRRHLHAGRDVPQPSRSD